MFLYKISKFNNNEIENRNIKILKIELSLCIDAFIRDITYIFKYIMSTIYEILKIINIIIFYKLNLCVFYSFNTKSFKIIIKNKCFILI